MAIIGVLGAVPVLVKGCRWLHKKWNRPKIVWGESDIPSSKRIDYYILVNNKQSLKKIKLSLTPNCLLPSDWKVSVTAFLHLLGCEHIQEVETHQENFKKHKEVEFDLPATGVFRLIIESDGGYVGALASHNLEEISIIHDEAKILYKPRKFPRI